VTGDLLVGADGFRSVVRNMFAPMIQPIYAVYVVWRGLADEDVIPKEAHAAVFNNLRSSCLLTTRILATRSPDRTTIYGLAIADGIGSGIEPSIELPWTICWSTKEGVPRSIDPPAESPSRCHRTS